METEKIRTFIALPLPAEIKKEISEAQKRLKKAGIKARWVKPEIAHLTLVFLGLITPDQIKPIGKILDEAASQIKPAKLIFHQAGCFPSPARARIIFVNLQGEIGKLKALSVKIRKQLQKENICLDDKPFSPHITLGRIKKRQNLTNFIKAAKVKKLEFTIDRIILYKSTLTGSGPTYQPLKLAFLKRTSPVCLNT